MKVVSVTPPAVMGVAVTLLSPLLGTPTHQTTPQSASLALPLPLTLASDSPGEVNTILAITCPLPISLWGPAAHITYKLNTGVEDHSSLPSDIIDLFLSERLLQRNSKHFSFFSFLYFYWDITLHF